MSGIEEHRVVVDAALRSLGCGWEDWPAILTDRRLDALSRLSGVVLLLAATDGPVDGGPRGVMVEPSDETLDWMGRVREPWNGLLRMRLPWTAGTAATALSLVTSRGPYDDRRLALALRGAQQVCSGGDADMDLLLALGKCVKHLEALAGSGHFYLRLAELHGLSRRIVASATPPELLDLSLLVDGDGWAAAARAAARAESPDDLAPLVRLLTDLGSRKPSQRWLRDVGAALRPPAARRVLRAWIELASVTTVVPEWPGSSIGACCGTLFVGSNTDLVRAAVWATSLLPEETWPVDHLARLATRGEAHNGAAGLTEALSLKIAAASLDVLLIRGTAADQLALEELRGVLRRKDLRKKIGADTLTR